jgi:hypothetical protein
VPSLAAPWTIAKHARQLVLVDLSSPRLAVIGALPQPDYKVIAYSS